MYNFALKFQAVAEKTTKDARGLLYFAAPGRDDGLPRFQVANHQSGGEDGCYREKLQNFVVWVEPDPKNSILCIL